MKYIGSFLLFFILLTSAFAAKPCGKGKNAIPCPPAPTPTASITASPSSITAGQASTLTWSTTNATSASITNVGTVPVNGSTSVSPASTTTYTLTATGSGGTAMASTTVTVTAPPPTSSFDQYGGITNVTYPATGYFYSFKTNNRQQLIDPLGHPFFMLSVYSMNYYDGGSVYANALLAKYQDTSAAGFVFCKYATLRMQQWGFNTIGEYASSYCVPQPMYGRKTGNPTPAPNMDIVRLSSYSMTKYQIKDIFDQLPSTYTGWRGRLVDAFDPNFVTSSAAIMNAEATNHTGGAAAWDASPWLISVTTDDGDEVTGLRSAGHAHPAWLIAVAPYLRYSSTKYNVTYTDPVLYSKAAWKDFLANKYGSITALDTAWGATYGTWDDLLNEDGSSPWIKTTDYYKLSNLSPTIRGDMNAFLALFADQYMKVVTQAVRAVLPHHLVSNAAAFDAYNRPEVFAALKKYYDIVQLSSLPSTANYQQNLIDAYNSTGKPAFLWTSFGSNPDSPLAGQTATALWSYPTQEQRAAAYDTYMNNVFALKGNDGLGFIIGIDWWAWVDKVVGGEHTNFGLVTYTHDNAYDGVEDKIVTGFDQWGYPVGGESVDYGNFIGGVTTTNKQIQQGFTNQQ